MRRSGPWLAATGHPTPALPSKGGSWPCAIMSGWRRMNGRSCPKRTSAVFNATPTPAEQALWDMVNRPEFAEFRFRRQHRLGTYFVDVAAPAIKLAIEADGEAHDSQPEHDEARDRALAERNWQTQRFRNEQILNQADTVQAAILDACIKRPRWRY